MKFPYETIRGVFNLSERRKRKENLITALLIAGMCIIVAGTIIFAAKYVKGSGDSQVSVSEEATLLTLDTQVEMTTPGTTESTAESTAGSTAASTSGSTSESTSASSSESASESTTAQPTVSVTPSAESSEGSAGSSETSDTEVEEEYCFVFSSEAEQLTSIADLKAGTLLSSSQIDKNNLSQYFTAVKIEEGDSVYQRINGKSYQKNNDIKLSDLRYLKMLHMNFNNDIQVGEMIVNKSVADEVLGIFKSLFSDGYQIYSMYLIDDFWEKNAGTADWNSIEANNTSCFCYRAATGGSKLSKHALGRAIDINPMQNPYVTYKDGKPQYSHSNAKDYVSNRSSKKAHVITTSDKAYKAFTKKGWTWGGNWSSPKDYQHFQK